MTTEKIYIESERGIALEPGRKAWGVDIPAYVYDLWMPVIGLDVVAVYGVLWRLARDGVTSGLSLKKLAAATRKGDKTLKKHVLTLQHHKFIKVIVPTEDERKMGITIKYIILDPPTSLPKGLMGDEYKPLCEWLVEKDEVSSFDDRGCRHLTTGVSSFDDLIDPSIDPLNSSHKTSDEVLRRQQQIYASRLKRGVEGVPYGEDAGKDEKHPLCLFIMQRTKAQALTASQLNKLSVPLTHYDAKADKTIEYESALSLWDSDPAFREWVTKDRATHATQFKWSRSNWCTGVTNLSAFLEWRKKNNQPAPVDSKVLEERKRREAAAAQKSNGKIKDAQPDLIKYWREVENLEGEALQTRIHRYEYGE